MSAHAYTEDQLVEQLTRDLLLPRLLSGQIDMEALDLA